MNSQRIPEEIENTAAEEQAVFPVTRLQLFGNVLKVRFSSLFGLNLLYMVAWIPAAAWTILNLMTYASRAETIPDTTILMQYLIVLAPLTAITGPLNLGVSFVLRNWARDEHAYTFSDMLEGVKANWKQGFLFSCFSAVLMLLTAFEFIYYYTSANGSAAGYIPAAIFLLITLVFDLASMLMPTMLVTYDLGFFRQLKNAFILTFAELPKAFLIKLITLIFPIFTVLIISLLPGSWMLILSIVITLYMFLIPAFNKLVIASYANMVCEKHINTKLDGALVNIGLRSQHRTVITDAEEQDMQ